MDVQLIGKRIGNYRILEKIGEGGVSIVYRAVDEQNQNFAIKFLKPELISDYLDDRIRFKREIEIVEQLNHPGIARYFSYGEYNGIPFLVMEFIDGADLHKLLMDGWLPTIEEAVRIVMNIAQILEYVHSKGVVHRDLKPGNLMILKNKQNLKIIDFGLAQLYELSKLRDIDSIVGTFAYMSPEATGMIKKDIDERSDLYSLGVIFYRLLTGRLPFF